MSDCRYVPNKMQFLSEQDAKAYVKTLHQSRDTKRVRLNPYQCPSCMRWHLTHWTKPAQRRINKGRSCNK